MRSAKRGNVIKSSAAEGMAAEKAPESEGRAAPRAMHGDGADGVFGASGLKAASAGAEGMQHRRQRALVDPKQGDEDAAHCDHRPGCAARAASARAWERIRTTSASSFGNSRVRTPRRGCRMRSEAGGSRSTWRRMASRSRRLMRLRSCAFPRTLPAVNPIASGGGMGDGGGLRREEPTHGSRLVLARGRVSTLEISVAAQAEGRQ